MNHAIDLFNAGRYDSVILEMRALLSYMELPNYWRMNGHALLASSLDDWYEAEVYLTLPMKIYRSV